MVLMVLSIEPFFKIIYSYFMFDFCWLFLVKLVFRYVSLFLVRILVNGKAWSGSRFVYLSK